MASLRDYPVMAVTGGTGWLGRRLVLALTQGLPELGAVGHGGCRVRCLVPPHESSDELCGLGAEVVVGDVRDPEAVRGLLADSEGGLVFHLAAVIHPPGRTGLFQEVNVGGTANVLAAAKAERVRRLVTMSSNSPIGCNTSPDDLFTEETPYRPYMHYGRSKWRMELLLRDAMEDPHAPEIVIARSAWFYGPGQPPRQTLFFRMIKEGRFPVMGKGLNRRSMGYVDSVALGLLLCAVTEQAMGRIYWLADERPYAMIEIVDTVKAVLKEDFGLPAADRNLVLPPVIADVARVADRTLQALGLYHQRIHVLSEMNQTIACEISKAKRELGYKPLVELREGMRRSVQWCLDNGLTI